MDTGIYVGSQEAEAETRGMFEPPKTGAGAGGCSKPWGIGVTLALKSWTAEMSVHCSWPFPWE